MSRKLCCASSKSPGPSPPAVTQRQQGATFSLPYLASDLPGAGAAMTRPQALTFALLLAQLEMPWGGAGLLLPHM